MDPYVILLRLVHVIAGVLWVGGVWVIAGFVEPTSRSLGTDGGRFMQGLVPRFSAAMFVSATLAVLSGLLLYWRASGGLRLAWITTGTGLALTVGGLAALAAFYTGFWVINRAGRRLTALGTAIQVQGAPPTPEQGAEMAALQEKMRQGGVWTAVLLVVTVVGMAVAQYLFL